MYANEKVSVSTQYQKNHTFSEGVLKWLIVTIVNMISDDSRIWDISIMFDNQSRKITKNSVVIRQHPFNVYRERKNGINCGVSSSLEEQDVSIQIEKVYYTWCKRVCIESNCFILF